MTNKTINEHEDLGHAFFYRSRLDALQCRDCEYIANGSDRDDKDCPALLQGLEEWDWQND